MIHPEQLEKTLNINRAASILQSVSLPETDAGHLKLLIKRDDRLHPIISGNKWRKLKYNLQHALNRNADHLISMGGPYSNHLHALAWVGKELGIKTTGLIRGEQPKQDNATLQDLKDWGMHLKFVGRSQFRLLRKFQQADDPPAQQYAGYWIGEGGAHPLALQGIVEMVKEIDVPFELVTTACGSGATLAGIASAISKNTSALGFAAFKNADYLNNEIENLIAKSNGDPKNWSLNTDYHFGGFAKTNDELNSFMQSFSSQTDIPLEPVYTGKMFYGLLELIRKNTFKPGSTIVAVHTGGLQGDRGKP